MVLGVERSRLVQEGFTSEVQALSRSLNTNVKWNFVVRFMAKNVMKTMDNDKLLAWVETPGQPFGALDKANPFILPDAVNACCLKVHNIAREILLPRDAQTDKELPTLSQTLQKESETVQVALPVQFEKVAEEILGNIYRSTGGRFLVPEKDIEILVSSFNEIFRESESQKLSDEVIDEKIRAIFSALEENPKTSPGRLVPLIKPLCPFTQEKAQKVLTDLSELFVRNNPYNRTVEEVFADAITSDNHRRLIGQSVIIRLPSCPVSLTIHRVEAALKTIKFYSLDSLSMEFEVDVGKKKITRFFFDRVLQTKLGDFVDADSQGIFFKVGISGPIPEMESPFEKDKNYRLEVEKSDKSTDYLFCPEKKEGETIRLRFQKDCKQCSFFVGKNRTRQNLSWKTCQELFYVETVVQEQYSCVSGGKNKVHSGLISLSSRPLVAEGAAKKALRDRDLWKTSILRDLLDKQCNHKDPGVSEAFSHLTKTPHSALPEALFNAIFDSTPMFQRLCVNQYVRECYAQGEEAMTKPLRNRFALDLLHEAQVCMLARVEPKTQQGNQDLIKELCNAAKLAELMRGKYAIPFIGSTGSGKSTAVSYLMGSEMEEFEDDFGERRIRHKEGSDGGPRIGFALGISETVHACSYRLLPPPPFNFDPTNPFTIVPKHDPEFKNGLTRENLMLADFPGYFDTRGTQYEVITNFSIDRAMDAFKSVPALVIVVPYENITANRAMTLYETLTDLEAKFPSLLKNKKLQKRMHFVITKSRDIGLDQIKLRLEQLVNEFRENGFAGVKYFDFLLHQLLIENVHLLNPLSSAGRLNLLNKIIDAFDPHDSDPIKVDYRGGFQDATMQLRIGDLLYNAIISWKNLLEGFLGLKKCLSLLEDDVIALIDQIEDLNSLVAQIPEELESSSLDIPPSVLMMIETNTQLDVKLREKEQVQWELRCHAVSIHHNKEIIQGTYSCSQGFKLTNSDDLGGMVQKKGAEVLIKCQEFVELYSTHFAEIEEEVANILGT